MQRNDFTNRRSNTVDYRQVRDLGWALTYVYVCVALTLMACGLPLPGVLLGVLVALAVINTIANRRRDRFEKAFYA